MSRIHLHVATLRLWSIMANETRTILLMSSYLNDAVSCCVEISFSSKTESVI